ncbi:MAG: hypothetical protein RSC46_10475, partial [Acinetobacter sp.]
MKDTIQKMTGSINDDRYKNLPLNCEYEFELFMELKGQFTKVTLINADLVETTYLSKYYMLFPSRNVLPNNQIEMSY